MVVDGMTSAVNSVIGMTDREFELLSSLLERNFGIHMKPEKQSLMISRLQDQLIQRQFECFNDYIAFLEREATAEDIQELVNRVTTNHTYFMREWDHFQFVKDTVLPHLKATVRDGDIRVWSAGCSSGEEPYTLAMMFKEYFGTEKRKWDTKILATDISSRVLERAAMGIYGDEQLAELPKMWRGVYFQRFDAKHSVVIDALKEEVIFRKFNLMDTILPFRRKFHMIFCRNVMIYFDAQTKVDLIHRFYECVEPGGYLFIGHSETLDRGKTPFEYVRPSVYRKRLE